MTYRDCIIEGQRRNNIVETYRHLWERLMALPHSTISQRIVRMNACERWIDVISRRMEKDMKNAKA